MKGIKSFYESGYVNQEGFMKLMFKTLNVVAMASLLLLAAINCPAGTASNNDIGEGANVTKLTKTALAGGRHNVYKSESFQTPNLSLGFDQTKRDSPGRHVANTTHDLQSNSRMNRQIDWRGAETIHLSWMHKVDTDHGGPRYSAYLAYDGITDMVLCSGYLNMASRAGFVSLDVIPDNRGVVADHNSASGDFMTSIYYDACPGCCNFSGIPLTEYLWPSLEYQIYDTDTVVHVFTQERKDGIVPQELMYYRGIGGFGPAFTWDYPPLIVDTAVTVSQIVTASRVSGKTALVWQAPPGVYPGDPESMNRDWIDPGLGVNQRINDVYIMMSNDLGASWGPKVNITAYDSSQGGWLGHGDMSALISSDNILHVVWNARETVPFDGGMGNWTTFWGARLYHWDELNTTITTIRDANWDLTEYGDVTCVGGSWNEMVLGKPQISECDGKLYTLFVQFHNFDIGFYNDCAARRYDEGDWYGTANGELYVSVSDNDGWTWDFARNLTNTYTPYCDTLELECDSDQWPSVSRYGMEKMEGDFALIEEIDPSGGSYNGNFYLDVLYVNDKFPGSALHDAGIWTLNPLRWFRLPCVDPEPTPVIRWSPHAVGPPAWVKPNDLLAVPAVLENIGNAPLEIYSISTTSNISTTISAPITLNPRQQQTYDIVINNPPLGHAGVISGEVTISSNSVVNSTVIIPIEVIVAETVQSLEYAEIRTECKRASFDNTGNMGTSGNEPYGRYNMNFFDECDVTRNYVGYDDNSSVYLFDASPFVAYMKNSSAILNYSAFVAAWPDEDAFVPLEGLLVDSTSHPDYRYGYSGKYCTVDSSIGLETEYFTSKHPDSCSFIVAKQKYYSRTGDVVAGVYLGDIIDFDVPSDKYVFNGSGFDVGRNMLYMYGAELGADPIANNDCILADERYAGYSWHSGFHAPYEDESDVIPLFHGMASLLNSDWIYPNEKLVPSEIYDRLGYTFGLEIWQSTMPWMDDSTYQDLSILTIHGEFDLNVDDTLYFIKIYSTEYDDGLNGLDTCIDKAISWISSRPELFDPESHGQSECDCKPGDADGNGAHNILDITYIINYLYKGGPPPIPYPLCSGDADCNCSLNILDATYLIKYLYKGGPPPCSCEQWLVNCGPPLRQ